MKQNIFIYPQLIFYVQRISWSIQTIPKIYLFNQKRGSFYNGRSSWKLSKSNKRKVYTPSFFSFYIWCNKLPTRDRNYYSSSVVSVVVKFKEMLMIQTFFCRFMENILIHVIYNLNYKNLTSKVEAVQLIFFSSYILLNTSNSNSINYAIKQNSSFLFRSKITYLLHL